MATHLRGDFVRGMGLFHGLTDEQIQQLLNAAEEVRYDQGQSIFEEGKTGRALFIIIEGNVRITLSSSVLTETELATLGPQDSFGESSFFHRAAHHATAECLSPVRVIRLRRTKFGELLASDNLAALKLAANAADLLGKRLQQTDEWIEQMLQRRQDAELVSRWRKFRMGIRADSSGSAGGFHP